MFAQLSEDSVVDPMCAASEPSSPGSYPWVMLTLLRVSVSPSNSLKPWWVRRAQDDQSLYHVSPEGQYLLNGCSGVSL